VLLLIFCRRARCRHVVHLIATVTLFFVANLIVFYVLALASVPGLGIAFSSGWASSA
jgi:hypothetical protein